MIASSAIKPAMETLMREHPELFLPNSNEFAAGVSNNQVLTALCENLQEPGANTCRLHPTDDARIVLVTGTRSLSFDVITPNGLLRTNGGFPVASCELGVQD